MMLHAIIWDVSPTIISVTDSYAIRWYGVLFAVGYLLAYFTLQQIFIKEQKPLPLLEKATLATIIGGILGARLGHCFFYEPARYLADPLSVLYIWEGGLASHGGAIGILIAFYFVSKYNAISYATLLARAMLVVPLTAVLIRIGNLLNSEIYGIATDASWGFVFIRAGESAAKHPTQIYEAIAYLLCFVVLQVYAWRQIRAHKTISDSIVIGIFLLGIFFSRFLIEFLKEPQVLFEHTMFFNMGQLLSVPFIIAGIVFLFRGLKRSPVV